jgi:hypothetical protein
MNDDLEFVHGRIPGYSDYVDEAGRASSDMRVRAFVGERLASARARLGPLEPSLDETLETVLLRCAFADQEFVKKFEHAVLDGPALAGLVRADRRVIELGVALETCALAQLPGLLSEIDRLLDDRRSPAPVNAT